MSNILNPKPYTVTRYSGNTAYVNGRPTALLPVFHTIEANIQPAKMNDLLILPEAERTEQVAKIYTDVDQDIRTASAVNNLPADEITYQGDQWRVTKEKTYDSDVLNHRKILATRINKG